MLPLLPVRPLAGCALSFGQAGAATLAPRVLHCVHAGCPEAAGSRGREQESAVKLITGTLPPCGFLHPADETVHRTLEPVGEEDDDEHDEGAEND